MTCTVYAVMKVMVEIPVRASSPKETLEELERVSRKEAEWVLRQHLGAPLKVVGPMEFSHAIVRADK